MYSRVSEGANEPSWSIISLVYSLSSFKVYFQVCFALLILHFQIFDDDDEEDVDLPKEDEEDREEYPVLDKEPVSSHRMLNTPLVVDRLLFAMFRSTSPPNVRPWSEDPRKVKPKKNT